jgi:hypothetical protein
MTLTYRKVKFWNLWKSWESKVDVEKIRKFCWKIAKNPIPTSTFRAANVTKDRPPDSNSLGVSSLSDSV